ncbi:MAG: hypothetical protein HYZ22_02760 [Chloroflexi bacterium]|nr:hypothetical protein [Chloroflexota bacterium]
MSNQEQERLRRLREKQIADRDPSVKQRNIQRGITNKARRMRKPFKLSGAWKDLPHVIRTPLYALILGIAVIFILPGLWASPLAIWVAILVAVILIVFGLVLGSSLDWRDSIKNQMK